MQAELAHTIPIAPIIAGYTLYVLTVIVCFRWWLRRTAANAEARTSSSGGADSFVLQLSISVGGVLIVCAFPIMLLLAVAALRN